MERRLGGEVLSFFKTQKTLIYFNIIICLSRAQYMKKFTCFVFVFLTLWSCKSYAQWINYYVNTQDQSQHYITDLQFSGTNTGWGAGYAQSYAFPFTFSGLVVHSVDGGLNWNDVTIPTSRLLRSLQVVDAQTVFAAGDSTTIIRTTNSGSTWQILNTPAISTTPFVWSLYFLDALTGWISTTTSSASELTYFTTNGGLSWSGVSNSGFSKLYFLNNTTGFAFNRTGLYFTTTGGAVWNNQISDSLITDFTFLNPSTGWCFTARSIYTNSVRGKGYNTTNGGTNWNIIYSNDTTSALNRVKFFDALSGYAGNAGSPSAISKTTNGGASWFNPTDFRYDFSNLYFANTSTGWAGGTYGFYSKTNSGPGNLINPYFAKLYSYNNSNQLGDRVGNYGFVYPLSYYQSGLEWPKGSGKFLMYYAGLCIGARVNGGIRIANNLYGGDFFYGHFDNGGNPTGKELGGYGVYTIKTGDGPGTPDWDNWPVSQGAPLYNGQPQLLGDMTSFTEVCDGYQNIYSPPLKAEVQMLVYGFNQPAPYDNILFAKYTIKNRSGFTWDSAYVSIFADPDVGTADNNKMGSDGGLGLAYGYCASNNDPIYGNAPPAIGIKILESPFLNRASSAVGFFPTNFYPCQNDPSDSTEIYYYLRGRDKCGQPFLYNNSPQKFVYSGDPETGTGWLMPDNLDVRFTLNAGPFTLNNNDTTSFLVALIVARGSSNLNSVTLLKQIAGQLPIGIAPISQNVPGKFSLNQNYPNPFNPTTKIKFNIPNDSRVGTVPRTVRLTIYDILGRNIATLVNQPLTAGAYEVTFDGTNFASGVYFYQLTSGTFTDIKKMILMK